MKPWNTPISRFSLPVLVMVVLTTIFVLVIAFMSIITYEQTNQHLANEWESNVHHNEQYLQNILKLINQGLLLFDHTFDASMKEQFVTFLDAYNQSGGKPSQMNLSLIKDHFSPPVRNITDIYIIDETGIVIDATYPDDIGLDFKIWPSVYERITNIRNGSSFQADRAVYGFGPAKKSRKFAYYPTPDHQNLLEISYQIPDFAPERRNFSYSQVMRGFFNETPHIRSITLYDSMYRALWKGGDSKNDADPAVIQYVNETFRGENRIRISDPVNASEVFYYFIEITDETTPSGAMLNLVARIDYDTAAMQEHLDSLRLYHTLVAIIAALLGFFIAYFLAYHLTRPIQRIINDINRIAHGDLNHRVSYSGSPEFAKLETSLNLLIAHVNDLISTLQEKERHLRESKEEYQILVEQLNEGIWIVDKNEKTTFVNTRMADMLESTPEKIVGLNSTDIIHPSCHDIMCQKVQNRHQGISERYEITMQTLNSTPIYAEISASPSFAEDGQYTGSFGVVANISQRKENEQKIREYTLKLEERTRELETVRDQLFKMNADLDRIVHDRTEEVMRLLEQKNDFIMQLGHDLRTPLTPILGLLPNLCDSSGEEHNNVLLIIERNVRHIQNIASKSLKLAKLNSLEYVPENDCINLPETIHSVLDINQISLRSADITTEVDVPEGCLIRGDQILIQELIDNLVSNSIKFSKPSGGEIRIHAKIARGNLILTVSDTGIGLMPGEDMAIFEEFYKSDHSRHEKSSTGLGLAICRKIVQKHNGTILAQSDGPDQGTTFTVTLPFSVDPDVFSGTDENCSG